MTDAVQYCVNALGLGGTYALLALGLALVFSILRLINFAYGELLTITGYVLVFGLGAGWATPVMIIVAIAAAGVASLVMERLVFRPFRGADATTLLLTSFALSAALQTVFQVVIGPNSKGANLSLVPGTITIAGVQVGGLQLTAALTSLVVLVTMTAFLTRSTLGISMRATADNFRVAQLMGIRANRVIFGAFLASGLMAGIAGVLWISQRASVDPLMGMSPVLKAFVAVIIGGMGSLSGAVLAALMLGALEVGFQTFLPGSVSGYRDAVVWLVVIAVLLWRPDGLFAPKAERV